MTLIILVTIWFAALAGLAVRIAVVRRERTGPGSWERSPHLLDSERGPFEPVHEEAIQATSVSRSETATAEHVRNGTQEDLYVGP
jgi:hypothetical protein